MGLTRRLFLRRAGLATALAPVTAKVLLGGDRAVDEVAAAPALSAEARASLELALAKLANPPVVLQRVYPSDRLQVDHINQYAEAVEDLRERVWTLAEAQQLSNDVLLKGIIRTMVTESDVVKMAALR